MTPDGDEILTNGQALSHTRPPKARLVNWSAHSVRGFRSPRNQSHKHPPISAVAPIVLVLVLVLVLFRVLDLSAPPTPMMSDELVRIFLLFIIGLICSIISWLFWTRQEVTSRSKRYRRENSPFVFWFYLTLNILSAVFFILMGIVFSISLLRSSGW